MPELTRWFVCALFVLSAAGCGGTTPLPEADASAPPVACAADADCDDGRFCNGPERCDPDASAADAQGCVSGEPPCAAIDCDESSDACMGSCLAPDADGDGFDSIACGGSDCDDTDRARAPGRAEVCDVGDVDEDCDPSTFGVRDADGDGEADAACCNVAADGTRTCGADCDDTRAGVGPTSPEVCNGRDDDCDGAVDEEGRMTFYRDADRDGFGDAADVRTDLCGPEGEYDATMAGDCDDTRADVSPTAREICNGRDDDCSSGGGAEPAEDRDGDGHTAPSYTACEPIPSSFPRDDCDDEDARIHPGAPYQREPRCDVGESCRRADASWACGVRVAGELRCDAELPIGPTWDYDCSGSADLQPRAANAFDSCPPMCVGAVSCQACAEYSPTMGCVRLIPLDEAFPVDGAGSCGVAQLHRTCSGATCPGECTTTETMLPRACR